MIIFFSYYASSPAAIFFGRRTLHVNLAFFCYCNDASSKQWTGQWQKQLEGPKIIDAYHQSASIVVHDSSLYAMICSENTSRSTIFRGRLIVASDNTTMYDIEWRQLQVIGGDIRRCAYLTVFGNNVIVTSYDNKMKLYTPFKDALVDIDELNIQFNHPVCGISGVSDGSLVVIGDVYGESDIIKSAVVQFKSKGTAIDERFF